MLKPLYFSQLGRVAVLDKNSARPWKICSRYAAWQDRDRARMARLFFPQSACMQVDENGSHLRQVWPFREYSIS